jgi:hypothetical protein
VLFGAQFTQVYATQGGDAERQAITGHASPERSAPEAERQGAGVRIGH